MDSIGALIFVVVVILSLAQKWKEGKEKAEAKRRWKEEEEPAEMSERARKTIHVEPVVREATRKGHAPTTNRQATEQRAKEVFESLFGGEIITEEIAEEEEAWEAVQPARRQELAPDPPPPLPREMARQASMESRGAEIASHEPAHVEARRQEEHRREAMRRKRLEESKKHEAQLRHREEHHKSRAAQKEQQRKQQHAQRKRQAAERSRTTRSVRPGSGRFLGDLKEVRKAIVFAEILGPPKAFED